MCPESSIFQQNVAPLFRKKLVNESKVIDQLLASIPYTRLSHINLDEDSIEQLHQLRVHTRRLRTLLQYLNPALNSTRSKRQFKQFRKAYGSIIKRTNNLRDQHVLQHKIQTWSTHGNERVKTACIWLTAYIQNNESISCLKSYNLQSHVPPHTRCAQSYDSHLDTTWEQSFHTLNQDFQANAKRSIRKKKIDAKLATVLGSTLDQLQLKANKEISTWLDGNKKSLHNLRIIIKELRYLLSPWRSYLNETNALLNLLSSLQEILGEIHDNQIQQLWLSNAIPKIANVYYRQSCLWMNREELASFAEFSAMNPSPMEGLMLIFSHLKKEERELVQYMRQRLDSCFKETLDKALLLLKIEIKYIESQANADDTYQTVDATDTTNA